MGHKHTRDEILAGAVETAFSDGLSQMTFGRVAKHLDINDRTVVYYFPTKDDLVSEVLLAMGIQLQATLAPAFAATQVADYFELLQTAWPILATDESDAVFALFFEANGLAVTGREPYATMVRGLVGTWIEWAAEYVEGDDDHRRVEAETAIAILDGLLLLRMLAGAEAAERAATRLGIISPD
jgi:AcrR family transcriptional regulator